MAIRNIVKDGDEILTKKCRPVTKFDRKLHVLLDDMAETMHRANGVGLAAPQVGILRRAVVIDVSPEQNDVLELVNPQCPSPDSGASSSAPTMSRCARRIASARNLK